MNILKKSLLQEIQEIDYLYLMGIFVATTFVGPLMNLTFFKFANFQMANNC